MTITKEQLNEVIQYSDSPGAIQILSYIKKHPEFSIDEQRLIQLQYIRMNSLSERQLISLIGHSLLPAFAIPNFDLDERVLTYIELIDNPLVEAGFVKNLIKVLRGHAELLGSYDIFVLGMPVKPTIGNWLKDYDGIGKGDVKDALAELEFLNKSPNTKNLNSVEKSILKNILRTYDHLVQRDDWWESVPAPKNYQEAFKDFNIHEFIPGVEDDIEFSNLDSEKITHTNVIPTDEKIESVPKDNIQLDVSERKVAPSAQSDYKTKLTPVATNSKRDFENSKPPKPTPQPSPVQQTPKLTTPNKFPARDLTGNAQIHDLINNHPPLKTGVVKDPTNIKITEEQQRLEQQRQQQVKSIQSKLEELRKRNAKK